jgi:hypothetical protein
MERYPIRSGRQVLRFVTGRRPAYAGVDPYNFYIDRDAGDNVVGFGEGGGIDSLFWRTGGLILRRGAWYIRLK